MNKSTPANNFDVIQKAKYSEGLDNSGQLELGIENVSIGLMGDITDRSNQPLKKFEMQKNKTALQSAQFAKDELIEDIDDPVLKEILESLSLSPQLLKAIGTTKKSQHNQAHIFRNKIEDPHFKKRLKAIVSTISFRDDYSRTLMNALASKYGKFRDELENELSDILKLLLHRQKFNLNRNYSDKGEGSLLCLAEDIRRYSHANAVDTDDDLAVLHHMSMELGGYGVFQISGKYLIIDQHANPLKFKEIQIVDFSSLTPIEKFKNKKILSTYTLKDHSDKLFMIEAIGDLTEDEKQWISPPAIHLVVYSMPDFNNPIAQHACSEPFAVYAAEHHRRVNHRSLLCATEDGVLVYGSLFVADFAYATDILLCTAASVSRVEVDDRLNGVGKSYDRDHYITVVVFDGGRQIAYYGYDSKDKTDYCTIAKVKLSHSNGQWKLSADSIYAKLKLDKNTNLRES